MSMLPNVSDCCRRAAASQFWGLIENAGFKLGERSHGIYLSVGNGGHAAVKNMLTHKIKTGELNTPEENIEVGLQKYEDDIKEAEFLTYDGVTPNQDAGKFQISRFVKFYQRDIAPRLIFPEGADPAKHIEVYYEHRLKEFKISGHVDLITKFSICDAKGGKTVRAYHSQLGGYANLHVTDGGEKPKYLIVHYLPRVHMDKTYPGTKIELYDVDFSMNESWYLVNQLIRDVNNFKESGNPACFQANPQSTLCSRKYCRAHKTNFCKYHTGG